MTEQLRIWAGLQGFISAASLIALLLFFALATPFGSEQRQWSWLGPVNDWLSVIGAAPWIVASVLLAMRVRAPWWFWMLTAFVGIAVLAAALVTVLMLAGRATLQMQFAFSIPMIAVSFLWLAFAGVLGVRSVTLPPWMGVFAVGVAVAFALGAALAGIAFAFSEASGWRMPLLIAGAVPGFLAMIALPVWWICVASTAH
jgi:hypothetical protein